MILEFVHYPRSRAEIHDRGGHNEEYIATLPYCRVEFVVYPYGDRWRARVERRTEVGSRTIYMNPISHRCEIGGQHRAQQMYNASPALWTLLDETAPPPDSDAENRRRAEFWRARAELMSPEDREKVLAGYAAVYQGDGK